MDTLSIIQNTPFSTSLVSPFDASTLYTIASRRDPDGSWADVVYRVERDAEGTPDESHKRRTELATVFYIDASTTRVTFARGLSEGEEGQAVGEQEGLDLDAFLRRRKAYSNSRVFVGADGIVYKWRINGERLELFNTTTHALIAHSNPRPEPKVSLPLSLMGITSLTTAAAVPSIFTNKPPACRDPRPSHPSLSLHPSLLDADSNSDAPQLLDAIVLTYIIMQRLLRERLRFRYP